MDEPGSAKRQIVSLLIPACNEEDNIRVLVDALEKVLVNYPHEILFIDDGSTDHTLEEIKKIREKNPQIGYISFSRNFGHQNALKAGLDSATGDCVISMDADLQHPPGLIPSMIEAWKDGYEIVYTIRNDNHTTSFFKRMLSKMFYRLNNLVSEVKIHDGTADFRLMDRAVVETLKNINESFPFYRGLIPWMGYRSTGINYDPCRRHAGRTKYSLNRRIKFAMGGLVSFSIMPLRIATLLGFIMAVWGFIIGLRAIYESMFTDKTVPGWTSIVVLVVLVGGVQLIILGIIGEYLGRLFIESKKRPHYIVRERSIGEDDG